MFGVLLLFIGASCISFGVAELPGAQFRISDQVLIRAGPRASILIENKLYHLQFGFATSGSGFFVSGDGNIKFAVIKGCHIHILPNEVLRLQLTGVNLYTDIFLNVIPTPIFKHRTDITLGDTDVSVDVKLSVVDGKPSIAVASSSIDIGDLDITTHESIWVAPLIAIIKLVIKLAFKNQLADILAKQVKNLLNDDVFDALKKFPKRYDIIEGVFFDYSLQQIQTASSGDHIDVTMKAAFVGWNPSQLKPKRFLTTQKLNKNLNMWVSEYTFNTAAEVFQAVGFSKDLPIPIEGQLNKVLKVIIPALWGHTRPLVATVESFRRPSFTFSEEGIKAQLNVRAHIKEVQADSSKKKIFHVDFSIGANGYAEFTKTFRLGGKIEKQSVTAISGDSTIGDIVLNALKPVLNAVLKEIAVKKINPYLEQGIALPIPDFLTIAYPAMKSIEDALFAETYFVFKW